MEKLAFFWQKSHHFEMTRKEFKVISLKFKMFLLNYVFLSYLEKFLSFPTKIVILTKWRIVMSLWRDNNVINLIVWNIRNEFQFNNFIQSVFTITKCFIFIKVLAKKLVCFNEQSYSWAYYLGLWANNGLKLWQNVSNNFRKVSQSLITLMSEVLKGTKFRFFAKNS